MNVQHSVHGRVDVEVSVAAIMDADFSLGALYSCEPVVHLSEEPHDNAII